MFMVRMGFSLRCTITEMSKALSNLFYCYLFNQIRFYSFPNDPVLVFQDYIFCIFLIKFENVSNQKACLIKCNHANNHLFIYLRL